MGTRKKCTVEKSIATLPKTIPEITIDNVEANVRTWLDHFGVGTQKLSTPDSYFMYKVTPRNGNLFFVIHLKDFDKYITLQAALAISPEHKILLDQLKQNEVMQLHHEIILELSRAKISNIITFPLQTILLTRRIPITSSLTEDAFMERVTEIDFALSLMREAIVLGLYRLIKDDTALGLRLAP